MTMFKGITNPVASRMLRLIIDQQAMITRLIRQGGVL